MAALVLIARGLADEPTGAMAMVRGGRPSAAPTEVDWRFVRGILARMRQRALVEGDLLGSGTTPTAPARSPWSILNAQRAPAPVASVWDPGSGEVG